MAFPAPPALEKSLNLFRIQMETLTPSPLGMQVIHAKGQQLLGSEKRTPLSFQISSAEMK